MNLMLYFFVVGMVENFFDFLTYPIITLGIPLIVLLWLKIRDESADLKENMIFTVKSSVSWGLGYALTWIAKWVNCYGGTWCSVFLAYHERGAVSSGGK